MSYEAKFVAVSAIKPRLLAGLFVAATILLATGPVAAQSSENAAISSPEEARSALERRKQELEDASRKADAIKADLAGLTAEREKLNTQLLDAAALIQKSEGQLTSIEGRIGELEAQEKLVHGSLAQRHDQIAKLLGALQRMGRNPPPVLITRREDALKMVRSAMLLASAFPELKGQALSLGEQLDDLDRVMTGIRSERERLRAENTRLNEMKTRLAGLMEARKLTLADRQNELQNVQAASAAISKSASDLPDLITKLDKAVTENTGLGAYQRELAAKTETAPAASAPAPPAASVSDATPAPTGAEKETRVATLAVPPPLKPRIIEIAPTGAGSLPGNPGRIAPALPFSSARGKLPMPAQGRRSLVFGERTQYGAQSKGILIETRANAQVTAPCDGWVVFAGEFRSYGQLLIINAGDGYHVLLAGMSQIDAQQGQFVLAAEPVGTMSNQFQRASTSPALSNAPALYVEFRKDGRPIDPDPWWVVGQQKVQG